MNGSSICRHGRSSLIAGYRHAACKYDLSSSEDGNLADLVQEEEEQEEQEDADEQSDVGRGASSAGLASARQVDRAMRCNPMRVLTQTLGCDRAARATAPTMKGIKDHIMAVC